MTGSTLYRHLENKLSTSWTVGMSGKRRIFQEAKRHRWVVRTAERLGLSPHLLHVCLTCTVPVRKAYLSRN